MLARLPSRVGLAWLVIVTVVATLGFARTVAAMAQPPAEEAEDACCCGAEAPEDAAEAESDEGGSERGHDDRCPPGCDLCTCCPGVALVVRLEPPAHQAAPVHGTLLLGPPGRAAPGSQGRIFKPPRPSLA